MSGHQKKHLDFTNERPFLSTEGDFDFFPYDPEKGEIKPPKQEHEERDDDDDELGLFGDEWETNLPP